VNGYYKGSKYSDGEKHCLVSCKAAQRGASSMGILLAGLVKEIWNDLILKRGTPECRDMMNNIRGVLGQYGYCELACSVNKVY